MPESIQNIKVVFLWKPEHDLRATLENGLRNVSNLDLFFPESDSAEIPDAVMKEAQIIVGWRPTPEIQQKARRLALFINPGAGVQHLIPLFQKLESTRAVTLVNGHGNAYFTAQHAVALLLALTNRVVPHHQWMSAGLWRRGDSHAASIPLRHRTVGFLGYGAVNRLTHQFLSGFHLKFAACRRSLPSQLQHLPTPLKLYAHDDLHAFLRAVDTLIVAVPLTRRTTGLIGMHELELLGENGLVVNVGRGPVICETSLFSALKNDVIRGAAIDVWYDYKAPPDEDNRRYPFHPPFHNLKNVIMSPHRAASPMNDLERWDDVMENIRRYAVGRSDFTHIVDLNEEY